MRIILWIFFWFLYFPLIRILSLLLFWHPKLEFRELWEKRNKFESLAHSFREKGIKADVCFEFSSEGEFQQVMPLIDDCLKAGKKIELVFFSPSVEKGVMALAQKNPTQIRYLRYPFVRIFPFIDRRCFSRWITATTLIMVRYDLFPEFLLWSMKEGNELKLLWFTFKKDRIRGKKTSFWKKLFLTNAKTIVYAVDKDQEEGKKLGFPGEAFDFRLVQISRRMQKKAEKFKDSFPLYPRLMELKQRHEKALIMGNTWHNDLFLLRDFRLDDFLLVVPHALDEENMERFREALRELRGDFYEVTDMSTTIPETSTILLNKKGVLCELYQDFTHAYVGGGFNGSIHSVLEPLVSGSDKISCGPQHHRSTEYDLCQEQGRITEVLTPDQFEDWFNKHDKNPDDAKMKALLRGYENAKGNVISC